MVPNSRLSWSIPKEYIREIRLKRRRQRNSSDEKDDLKVTNSGCLIVNSERKS